MTGRSATTITEHLEELRNRVFKAAVAIVVGAIIAFVFRNWLFDLLVFSTSLTLVPTLSTPDPARLSPLALGSAALLTLLLLWSLVRGSWQMAVRDLLRDIASWRQLLRR